VATMKRALRPNDRLVAEDTDFRGSFCEPESAMFARYEDIYEESARQRVRPLDCPAGSGDVCRRRTRSSSADNRSTR
jgi:hypothetical protein